MRRAYILYYLLTLAAAVFGLWRELTAYNAALALAAFALPVVPQILWRLCALRPVPAAEGVYLAFVFAAVPFASLFGAYDWLPYWDKILHFLSGVLLAAPGLLLYYYARPDRALSPKDCICPTLFGWMFAVSCGVLWEFWEYFVSFSGADPQQVATTGVGDTMQDLLVCALGALLTARAFYRYLKGRGRRGAMVTLFDQFYHINIAPDQPQP